MVNPHVGRLPSVITPHAPDPDRLDRLDVEDAHVRGVSQGQMFTIQVHEQILALRSKYKQRTQLPGILTGDYNNKINNII